MALLNFCGFEAGDLTTEVAVSVGSPSVASGTKRSGDYSLENNNANSRVILRGLASSGLVANFGRTGATYITLFIYIQTLPSSGGTLFCTAQNSAGTGIAWLRCDPSGDTYIQGLAGAQTFVGTMATGQWYRWDFKAHTNNTCSAKMNNGSEVTVAGINATFDRLEIGGNAANGQLWYIDDVFVDDSAFTTLDTIKRMDANAEGTDTAWTNSYTSINEIPHDGDTNVIFSSASSAAETYGLESCSEAGILGSGFVVKQGAVMRESTSDTTLAGLRMRSGGTTSDTTPVDVGTTAWVLFAKLFALNPDDSAAWEVADLDALQVGVVKGADASQVNCTSIWAMVAYLASTITIPPKWGSYRRRRTG